MRRPRILRGTTKDAEQAATHAPTPAPELPDSHYDSVAWLERGYQFCPDHMHMTQRRMSDGSVEKRACPDCPRKVAAS